MALAGQVGQGDRAALVGRGDPVSRAALLVLAGPVGTRRLATQPGAQLPPTPRDTAVVKLAKYRFGPIGGE